MDEEIVLDRGQTNVMKLDADEQALMDEIQISAPRPKPCTQTHYTTNAKTSNWPNNRKYGCFCESQQTECSNQNREDEEIDYGEDEPMMFDDELWGQGPGEQAMNNLRRGIHQLTRRRRILLIKFGRLREEGFRCKQETERLLKC